MSCFVNINDEILSLRDENSIFKSSNRIQVLIPPPSNRDESPLIELNPEDVSHLNFEKRGIAYLYNAYEGAKRALSRWGLENDVHQKKAKAYIIKEVYEELTSSLKRKD